MERDNQVHGDDHGAPALSALAVPDIFLGESHLAAARAVLGRVTAGADVRLAFVSGSLAAGLGHALSDVDLYVHLAEGLPPRLNYREGDFYVEVNPVSAAQLDLIMSTCSGYLDTPASRPQTTMAEEDLVRAIRFAIGTVLVSNVDGLPGAADSRRAVRRLLMNRNAYILSTFAEDTAGALRIGDYLTALQSSLMVVELALECALAGAGDVYLGRKFALRRAARTAALRDVLPDLWGCLSAPALTMPPAEIGDFILRRMLFASHLVGCALLDGWDEPLASIPRFADKRAEGGPVRSPWVTPTRFADYFGMAGPDIGYRSSEAMIRLWWHLDGRCAEAARQRMARHPLLSEITLERLDTAIKKLVEMEAAVPGGGALK